MEWIIFQSHEIYLLDSIFEWVESSEIGKNERYSVSVSVLFPKSLFPFTNGRKMRALGAKNLTEACAIDADCFPPRRRSRETKTGNAIAPVSNVLRQEKHKCCSRITHVGLVILAGPLQAMITESEQIQSSHMKGLLSRVF